MNAISPHQTWNEGQLLGTSGWLKIDQNRIDGFGHLTDDIEPLHNDPDWCRDNSPFGKTIAHGFLTLSMLTRFISEITLNALVGTTEGRGFPLNYGFDKIRFIAPVSVGSRIRCLATLCSRSTHRDGDLLRFDVTIEIDGEEKPALTAEWLTLWVTDGTIGA
ncbi:MAG: MaoC family dehydratase [Sphingorhabdus sp.]|nr:MaoC family dehydratase [Novosphingobium sp.]